MPAEVESQIEEELEKLAALEKNSSEFNVTRYLPPTPHTHCVAKFSLDVDRFVLLI